MRVAEEDQARMALQRLLRDKRTVLRSQRKRTANGSRAALAVTATYQKHAGDQRENDEAGDEAGE